MMIRLQFPIDSGLKGVPAAQYVVVRNPRPEELEALRDATPDQILGVVTSLSPSQVSHLAAADRAAIVAARRSMIQ